MNFHITKLYLLDCLLKIASCFLVLLFVKTSLLHAYRLGALALKHSDVAVADGYINAVFVALGPHVVIPRLHHLSARGGAGDNSQEKNEKRESQSNQ